MGGPAKLLGDALAFQAADTRVRQMEDAQAERERYAAMVYCRQR